MIFANEPPDREPARKDTMDWMPLILAVLAVAGSAVGANLGTRGKLREISETARTARWAALDDPRHDAYAKLWRLTWPMSRHCIELDPPSVQEVAEMRNELLGWYSRSGFLMTGPSVRKWRLLVDACTPFLAEYGGTEPSADGSRRKALDDVAQIVFADGHPNKKDLSWELPETLDEWYKSSNNQGDRDLLLLAVIASDLRSSLSRDLHARGSARDFDRQPVVKSTRHVYSTRRS